MSEAPKWDGVTMTMHSGTSDDILTANGGDKLSAYTNLPFDIKRRFPMYGTTDINTQDQNDVKTLVLHRPTLAYMLRSPERKATGMEGWEYMESGKFFGSSFGYIDLYQNVMSEGTYSIQTSHAMYLFSYNLQG